MYLKKTKTKDNRVYLSIAKGHYDPALKRTRTVNIQKIGYLDALTKEYADPIGHFTSVIDEMNRKNAADKVAITLTVNGMERVSANIRKNFGYVALSAVYHELEIDRFFANRQQSTKAEYNMNAIMRLLVFSRLLAPGSKKKAYDEREWFFERSDFSLADVYRSLSRINTYRNALQLWMHERITAGIGRDTTVTYYDVTNNYFEIDGQDALRRKGVSKEHRPDPIVQMGLFMDNSGMPVAYQLFAGNQNDCTTLLPIIKRIRKEYGIGKAVVVSDKGMNTQKTRTTLLTQGEGMCSASQSGAVRRN